MEIILEEEYTARPREYAGFWRRFVAYIIDGIIVQMGQVFIISPILAVFGFTFGSFDDFRASTVAEEESIALILAFFSVLSSVFIITLAIQLLYHALMNSSSRQATVGKMALGMKVTDMHGKRLSVGKALVRELGKFISGVTFLIGYIMAAFTSKKQALHDIIANTVVIRE